MWGIGAPRRSAWRPCPVQRSLCDVAASKAMQDQAGRQGWAGLIQPSETVARPRPCDLPLPKSTDTKQAVMLQVSSEV
jgi:hypothetical protein